MATRSPGEPCWACKKPKDEPKPNDLVEEPNSVGLRENDLKNDSSKLGLKLGHRPSWHIKVPDRDKAGNDIEREVEVVPAAHHLIPGNASLRETPALLKFIEKSRGRIREDIGYDVNSNRNGVWLAANYGVRSTSEFGQKWSKYSFQDEYAIAAMKAARTQFHDTHPTYSTNVKGTLRALAAKLELVAPQRCGVCGEEVSDKARPPYGLVGRLDAVSRQYRRFLAGPVRKWPLSSGYFTSSKSALMLTSTPTAV